MGSGISISEAKIYEYEKLISEGKGIKLGVYTRIAPHNQSAPKLLARYLFVRLEDGIYLTQDQFDQFPPHKIEQIQKLVQMTFDANRISDDKDQAERQTFVSSSSSSHLTYVTSLEEGEIQKPLRCTKLEHAHKTLYSIVRRASVNLEQILNCSTKEGVNDLDNRSFVKIYNHVTEMFPFYPHNIIFNNALRQYTEQSLDRYLHSLSSTHALQEILTITHQKIGSDDLDFENKEHVRAVFHAIEEHGNHHLTTEHAFLALTDTITELCHELISHSENATLRQPSAVLSNEATTLEGIFKARLENSSRMISSETHTQGFSRAQGKADWQFALSQIENFEMSRDDIPSARNLEEDLNRVEKADFYQSLICLIREQNGGMNDLQKFALHRVIRFIKDNDESPPSNESVLGMTLVQILQNEAEQESPLS